MGQLFFFLSWDLKTLITSYVSIQQWFWRQHNIGRPTIRSCCYPSLCTDTCRGQPYCWYIEQSTERPGINIWRKWRWRWRWGANVGHNTSWVQCSWSDRGGSGCWIWRDATSNTESSFASAAKNNFTTTSGRFARVVLDVLFLWFSAMFSVCCLSLLSLFSLDILLHCALHSIATLPLTSTVHCIFCVDWAVQCLRWIHAMDSHYGLQKGLDDY